MLLNYYLAFSLSLNSFNRDQVVVVENRKETNLDLGKYSDLKLKPEVRQETIKTAGVKTPANTNIKPRVKRPVFTPEHLDPLFNKYSQEYGVDKQVLIKIADCESKFNPQAVNGSYAGMYQFLASTWISNRKAMGQDPNPSLRFNPEEAIKTTAFKISQDGTGTWPVCGR